MCDICEFLERDDVLVGLGDRPDLVVHHKYWLWEGRATDIICAARMAIRAERKYKKSLYSDEYCGHCGDGRAIYQDDFCDRTEWRCIECGNLVDIEFKEDDEDD